MQRGRSMIEMLGVLAVIGMLSIGGIAGYSKAAHRYRIVKFLDQLAAIAMNIATLCSSEHLCEGFTKQDMIQAGAIPAETVRGGEIILELGQSFNVWSSGSAFAFGFRLSLEDCLAAAPHFLQFTAAGSIRYPFHSADIGYICRAGAEAGGGMVDITMGFNQWEQGFRQ